MVVGTILCYRREGGDINLDAEVDAEDGGWGKSWLGGDEGEYQF